ncbi:hypothetical protein AVEN_131734-1 [Araneus ventricosus]|uniref:Uncharacterized protein n=1 Tax=Araneus ventricosus TaxID=182803 RepID=A0A4Y2P4C5_ARAVE|nr:hypothetical protein AVEN_131734-1 [Araneus ventricosus]
MNEDDDEQFEKAHINTQVFEKRIKDGEPLCVKCGKHGIERLLLQNHEKANREVPVPENRTQEEENSSSEVLINTPQINSQPAEPGTNNVKPPSPTKHLHKISPILRLSQVTAKHRIKKPAALLTSIDNRNALKSNLEK